MGGAADGRREMVSVSEPSWQNGDGLAKRAAGAAQFHQAAGDEVSQEKWLLAMRRQAFRCAGVRRLRRFDLMLFMLLKRRSLSMLPVGWHISSSASLWNSEMPARMAGCPSRERHRCSVAHAAQPAEKGHTPARAGDVACQGWRWAGDERPSAARISPAAATSNQG